MADQHQLTLMAVHAHPDDEASSTGGILARYGKEGIRTVLVTCTNGALGDGPNGEKPEEEAHDRALVIATRERELEQSCAILGLSAHHQLGYNDSGMMGWPDNDRPGSFWTMPVEAAALPLVDLMQRYRPDVVVTYDDYGFYGHPDHIMAHRITMAAIEQTGIPKRLFFPAIPRSVIPAFNAMLAEGGVEPPEPSENEREFGTDDELIAAEVDCSEVIEQKLAALAAHKSQTEDTFFLKLAREHFVTVFGHEYFVCARDTEPIDRADSSARLQDLFEGLR